MKNKLFECVDGNQFKLAETDKYLSGMKKDSARPFGTQVFDATVSIGGQILSISTPKGDAQIQLTPEQAEILRSEIENLI